MKHQSHFKNGLFESILYTGLALTLTAMIPYASADDRGQFPHPGQNPGYTPGPGHQNPSPQNPGQDQGPGHQNPGQGQNPRPTPTQPANPIPIQTPVPTPTPTSTPIAGYWDMECDFSMGFEKGQKNSERCIAKARVRDSALNKDADSEVRATTLDEMAALDEVNGLNAINNPNTINGNENANSNESDIDYNNGFDNNIGPEKHSWLKVDCGKGELFKGMADPQAIPHALLIKGIASPEYPNPATVKLDELKQGYVSAWLRSPGLYGEGICHIRHKMPPPVAATR